MTNWQVQQNIESNDLFRSEQQCRPSFMLRPKLSIDGDKWCALLGENLQDGVCGFGDTPDKAYADFDRAWHAPLQTPSSEHLMKGFDNAVEAIKSA